MIKGMGIDIVEIQRIEEAIKKSENFLDKIFTDKEIEYFTSRKMNVQTIAGNFAAKEAVVKALGTGFGKFEAKDIEVIRNEYGAPLVSPGENLDGYMKEKDIKSIFVSISHDKKYAIANAIAE